MRTARTRGDSGIYHVVSRGVGQQIIFESDADRRRYLSTLQNVMAKSSGHLLAWCLMDNHVHLLIRQPMDELSTTMRRLNSGYALYFNLVHNRSGHLFQGRFYSEPIDSDEYLMTVVRYIHQNPLKAGMATSCQYEWSSYKLYALGNPPVGGAFILDMFDGTPGFIEFHSQKDPAARCIDISQPRPRVDDEGALAVARSLFGDNKLGEIKALSRQERNAALAMLKEQGLTTRQIQRLTGISLGVISKA